MTKRNDPEEEHQASLARATLAGVLWMTAGRFLKAPTNLVAVAVLARLLTPADFGVVALAFVITALATMLVDGTFGMVLIQRPRIDPPLIGASLLTSAALGGIFGLALALGGPAIQQYFNFPDLAAVVRMLAVVLPVSAVMAVTTALLQRASRFGILTINSFIAQLAGAVSAITLAFAGFGVWSLVWWQLVQVTIETLLGYLAVRTSFKIGFSISAIHDVIRSGGMFTISKLFNWAAGNIDRVVIGQSIGATPLGLYSRASTLMATANQLVGTGTARVLFSTFAKMQHDISRMRRAFDRAMSTALIAASFASAFVILFAEPIVRILLGPKWLETVPILQALFAAFVTRSGYVVAEAVPLALGLSRASAYRQAAQFLLVIGGTWIGSRFGALGAAVGIAISYWIFYLLCLILVHQLLDIRAWRLLQIHVKGMLAATIPVTVIVGLRSAIGQEHNLWVDVALAGIFGLVAAGVVALAPEPLLCEDIVRMRGHALRLISTRLRRLVRAR